MSKDNYKGVAIQVCRKIEQLKPDANNVMTTFRNFQTLKQTVIAYSPNMKDDVAKALVDAKEFLAQVRSQEKEIDGLLNDYLSQNVKINEPEQK